MAKKAPKKSSIAKKKIVADDLMKDLGHKQDTVAEKDLEWIPFNDAFFEQTGLPGLPKGETSMFRGFSDTGKSTAMYEAIAGAMKTGVFPIIFDTEGSFKWDHARDVGMKYDFDLEEQVNEDTGEIVMKEINRRGNFLFYNGDDLLNNYECYDHSKAEMGKTILRHEPVIEDIAKTMNDICDRQRRGEFQQDVLFIWDSIGSINCFKGATKSASNNMWTAGALNSAFQSLLHFKIPSTKRENSPYTNTFMVVNKIWLDSTGMGAPIIKMSGGNAFHFGSRIIVHMGGKTTSSASKAFATTTVNGVKNEYQLATITKIEVVKNHVTQITKKGKIACTALGYYDSEKVKTEYKNLRMDSIRETLGLGKGDYKIEYELEEGVNDNQTQE